MSPPFIEPTRAELEDAKEQFHAVQYAAKLLPPGTRISLRSGTISEVRALAAAMGCEVYLQYHEDGRAVGEDETPHVIESARVQLERGIVVDTLATRPAEPGDIERAESCRRRHVEFLRVAS